MAAFPYEYEISLYAKDTLLVFDHFTHLVTTHLWTTLAADSGTSASVSDAAGGKVALTTGATDNNEAAVRTTTELFLIAANKPIRYAVSAQYAEANTDDANVFLGLMSALAANSLVDDGAGPRTTGNTFGFYKVDGGTVWQAYSRNGSETYTNSTGVTAGGANFHKFEIFVDKADATHVNVHFKIDDVLCRDATTNLPIKHTVLVSGSTEMNAGAYVKAGGANSEVLTVDWLSCSQKI